VRLGAWRGGLPAFRGAPIADVRVEFDRFFDGRRGGDSVKRTKWILYYEKLIRATVLPVRLGC
jgi:hypothetical protein